MRLQWWRYRVIEFCIGLVTFSCIMYLIGNIQQRSRESVAAGTWFVVSDIFVPDHEVGSNPEMTYDRTIKGEFQGFWVVEVQRQDTDGSFTLECSGSGVNEYEPRDYIPNNTVRWDWFIGKSCADIPPGDYRLRASWVLRRSNWPEKTVVKYSNPFKVMARR